VASLDLVGASDIKTSQRMLYPKETQSLPEITEDNVIDQ